MTWRREGDTLHGAPGTCPARDRRLHLLKLLEERFHHSSRDKLLLMSPRFLLLYVTDGYAEGGPVHRPGFRSSHGDELSQEQGRWGRLYEREAALA